jgi:hypothetical protein
VQSEEEWPKIRSRRSHERQIIGAGEHGADPRRVLALGGRHIGPPEVAHDEDIGDGLISQGVDNALARQARAIPGYG